MRKGITPVIAIIILLFITIALAGAAWTFLEGYFRGQISKTFSIIPGGAYCEAGTIKVYVMNTGYDTKLSNTDFILHDIGAIPTTLAIFDVDPGVSVLAVSDDNTGSGWGSGYHTIHLGTFSTVQHPRVNCP